MEFFLNDLDITEGEIPNPEACGGPYRGDGICADQKPQQMMMKELSYGDKCEIATTIAVHGLDVEDQFS